MAIFNSYVKLPEGNSHFITMMLWIPITKNIPWWPLVNSHDLLVNSSLVSIKAIDLHVIQVLGNVY